MFGGTLSRFQGMLQKKVGRKIWQYDDEDATEGEYVGLIPENSNSLFIQWFSFRIVESAWSKLEIGSWRDALSRINFLRF